MSDIDPPMKRLRFTLELDAHDRDHLTRALYDMTYQLETTTSVASVSSQGWSWRIEERSDLTPEEYERQLMAWSRRRRETQPSAASRGAGAPQRSGEPPRSTLESTATDPNAPNPRP